MAHEGYYTGTANIKNVNELLAQAELYKNQAEDAADAATLSASNAQDSETAAASASVSAATSATNALNSATSAATSASNAATSSASATSSATAASTSASNAASSASSASTSATNAGNSATAAAASASAAAASESSVAANAAAAAASASAASTSATTASTAATNAGNSATAAASSASSASTSATNAGNSATAAASSASSASTSATNAGNSATLAQAWAENPEDVPVTGGLYSAHHWATKTQESLADVESDIADLQSGKLNANAKNVCTAWVNFNGTGVVAIRDSYNVSSITDNGTGDYTINFTSARANANYALVLSARGQGGSGVTSVTVEENSAAAPTTSGFRIFVKQGAAAIDSAAVHAMVMGG